MTDVLTATFRQALADPSTLTLLATLDEHGIPHLEEKRSVHVDSEGQIVVVEDGEYSRTNLNLVRSLWFDRRAALYVIGLEHRFEVVLEPYKVHISGPLFESHYRQALEKPEGNTPSGIWILHPVSVTEETDEVRVERENTGRLPLVHLDRIAKKPEELTEYRR